MNAYHRPAVMRDAWVLAPILRKDDLRELRAASGRLAHVAIADGIKHGPAWTMCDDEGPFGIFGVVPHGTLKDTGVCWMVSSERLHKHARQFLKANHEMFAELHKKFPVLTNFVDARNAVHIKWLRWMGFSFINIHQEYGVEKMPFYEIVHICQS